MLDRVSLGAGSISETGQEPVFPHHFVENRDLICPIPVMSSFMLIIQPARRSSVSYLYCQLKYGALLIPAGEIQRKPLPRNDPVSKSRGNNYAVG